MTNRHSIAAFLQQKDPIIAEPIVVLHKDPKTGNVTHNCQQQVIDDFKPAQMRPETFMTINHRLGIAIPRNIRF